jgi:acyl transferase domain-containing protein/phosphopantetheinyl transferase
MFTFWDNVMAGRSAIRDVPPDRWEPDVFHDPDSTDNDRVAGRHGGYLDQPIHFDPTAHGIMPLTVEGGEPEQFLILDAARSALIDAGLPDGPSNRSRVEVIIGRGNYFNHGNLTRLQHGRGVAQLLGILRALHPEWIEESFQAIRADLKTQLPPFEAATIPGQLTNATAGRLAHRLDLNGACYVVDAASASSLVALDLGAQALVSGRADLAIVGGVYVEADVDFPMVFSRLGVLSRSGEALPFTRKADGLVPGEGVGVVILKRLADAERDGDRVYAVIKGIGLASDGRSAGIASPSARGHLRAIRRAYRSSGIDPATVQLIEGHGLSVPAADRAELNALFALFPPQTASGRRVLGAVSALIGHAMPAAGMAGLIKAALALFHRTYPVSQGADHPNNALTRSDSPFSLNSNTQPWIQGSSTPRRAGVNSFGFAGINAHALLEEHTRSADNPTAGVLLRWPDEAILLAEPDRAALIDRIHQLASRLRVRSDIALKDLAYTLNTKAVRQPAVARLGLVVTSVDDLRNRLETLSRRLEDPTCLAIRDARGSYFWERPLGVGGGLAFLFPGEGSQYPGMLADLCLHFHEVRALFDTADRLALESGAIEPPCQRLFGASGQADSTLWQSGTAVNVVLSSQWAIYTLLRHLRLTPTAILGHSSGEFLALAAAGAVRVDRRLEERFNDMATMFARLEEQGLVPGARLVSVAVDRSRVEAALVDGVSVAVDNCPHQVVIAGPEALVDRVTVRLRNEGIVCEELPFARAYHTPAFAPALGPVRAFYEALEIEPPSVPLYSCCDPGQATEDPNQLRRLAVAQWTRPVEFRRAVEAMHNDGLRLFVDVGARGNLVGFVEDILRGQPAFAVAANLPRRSGLTQLNHLVASLFAQGIALCPDRLYVRRRPQQVDLDAPPPSRPSTFTLELGFPRLSLSESLLSRLREQSLTSVPPANRLIPEATTGFESPNGNGASPPSIPVGIGPLDPSPARSSAPDITYRDRTDSASSDETDAALLDYLQTMKTFLNTQRRVMNGWLVGDGEVTSQTAPMTGSEHPRIHSASTKVIASSRSDPARDREAIEMAPGPWAGVVRSLDPGRSVVATLTLDQVGDPVGSNHTFGGRRISAVDPSAMGLPVLPFTVMAEMLAEVAARLAPGRTLVGLRDVRARRWIRYEDTPITLELRAEVDSENPGAVRAYLSNRGRLGLESSSDPRLDVEGVAIFADRRPDSPQATRFDLGRLETSRFTAESLYGEQWLFHGPALRAVVGHPRVSLQGIEGTLRVLPRRGLLRDPLGPSPLTDPIVLDAFTHLLGCWGLDRLAEGDVIFPLRMGHLDIYGSDPPEGTDLACRIAVRSIERHRVRVDAEIVRPNGRVWMRIQNWEDWRFYWPPRYRDVFRMPDRILVGEPLTIPRAGLVAVWLQPPADMGRPVWRDVLEQIQLSPEERQRLTFKADEDTQRTLDLWARIAAKEAARRLWLTEGALPVYPADLSIQTNARGRILLRSRLEPNRDDLPALSMAHTEGVAIALAARSSQARIGIDVAHIDPKYQRSLTPRDQAVISTISPDQRRSWATRLHCARQAVAKATGEAAALDPTSVEIVSFDPDSGTVAVRLGSTLVPSCPDLAHRPISADTSLRGEFAWAWTLLEGPAL